MQVVAHSVAVDRGVPGGILAARTPEELRLSLAVAVRALFPGGSRHEVHFTDAGGRLALDPRFEPSPRPGAGALLGSLQVHLALEGGAGEALPPSRAVRHGRFLCAPVVDARARVGLLLVGAAPGSPAFSAVDVGLLECVAGQVSSVLLRQGTVDPGTCSVCVERYDRASAGLVQRRLMNAVLPHGAGVTVDARYQPALEVGGDFYDVADLGDGTVACTIGDVSGKGVSAALIMSRVSSDLRRALRGGRRPSEVLRQVNDDLAYGDAETFVTASCLRLDPTRRRLTVANAGHVPVLLRRASGEVLTVGTASGTPLGMLACEYADEEVEVQPRDILLLMTDGLTEALDRPDDRLGTALLRRLVRAAPHDPKAIGDRLIGAANAMRGDVPPDDVTLLSLQVA